MLPQENLDPLLVYSQVSLHYLIVLYCIELLHFVNHACIPWQQSFKRGGEILAREG